MVVVLVLAGTIALGVSQLGAHKVVHILGSARPGWVVAALALMMLSLVARAASWLEILRAAVPDGAVRWPPVLRATMIGVMGSAVFPGRLGEPARVLVVSRQLSGPARQRVPLVAGTVLSQLLLNLVALTILAVVTFSSVPLFHGHEGGVAAAATLGVVLFVVVIIGPRLLAVGRRSRSKRVAAASVSVARLLELARHGLVVFATPRRGIPAALAQLGAWVLQWLSCYTVLLALGLQGDNGAIAAAAVLLAVNVSAVLPPTPANVGVFQAACVVVLAAFGVGAGAGLAYGILLQAVEVVTALALGSAALLGEGMTWREVRRAVSDQQSAEAMSPAAPTSNSPPDGPDQDDESRSRAQAR